VFEFVAVFPLSIFTLIVAATAFAGNVNQYHTSFVVPHVLVAIPSLVAWYKSPLVPLPQVVTGVIIVADEQLLLVGCESKSWLTINKQKNSTKAFLAVSFMVFQNLDVD
jgi:hypothetical protein